MGCFDYECACGGTTCVYVGSQNGGGSTVVIEVPLNDGKTIYVKGHYNSYGGVETNGCTFYPEQFKEYFHFWLEHQSDEPRSKIFLAKKIWTMTYKDCDDYGKRIVKNTNCYPEDIDISTRFGTKTIKKFIRADDGLNILSDKERRDKRIKDLTAKLQAIQKELEELGEV